MQKSRDELIDELLIKQEIRDIQMRYCRGVNRLDMDLVRSCFHPDAWEDHGAFKGEASLFCDSLGDALQQGFQFTFHFIGNSLIEIEGNRAAQEAYFIGWHRLHPEADGKEKDVIFGGRYLGVHESRDGGPWLIAERTVVHDWHRIDPVVEKWPHADAFTPGRQGNHEDLVFHLLKGTRAG